MTDELAPKPQVLVFTDGACSGNPGPGGWGAILMSGGHRKELRGMLEGTSPYPWNLSWGT